MSGHAKPMVDGKPVEIERKYLITPPDEKTMRTLSESEGYTSSYIEQIYITGENGEGGRIRRRDYGDKTRYYYTLKQNINGLSRFETEFEITAQEYARLAKTQRPETQPIKKVRHCFVYSGQLFELDVYEMDKSFATLEIELESEDQQVTLPDFIGVIKDVTGDVRYSNFTLSHSGCPK